MNSRQYRAASRAVDAIINGLEGSDFVVDHGRQAIEGLKVYKTDMVEDICRQVYGATREQLREVAKAARLEHWIDLVDLDVDESSAGCFVRSEDVPGLHLLGSDLLSMKGSIESAIIRLTRDNEGRTVRVAEWLSERQLRLETI